MDRYAVIGHPVEHSKSPLIHAAFAQQTGQQLEYGKVQAPLDGFVAIVTDLQEKGYRGVNVTVPFKFEAYSLATELTPRARDAGAVNTLTFTDGAIHGDNTDGVGLVRDILQNLAFTLAGKRVLLLGAGGAAEGVLAPLLEASPLSLCIANRTVDKAEAMAARVRPGQTSLDARGFDALADQEFDVVINATSSGLHNERLPLPSGLFAADALAYDMMYGRETPFMRYAREEGASRIADGLGMLVEQAAEAFYIWRRVRPDTAPVMAALRAA
ncbi:shikimate dehydrogenase [Methylobacillus flagellatus]|uniref:Shikimate dehydrogenase (NADP(+)) n=1 Tax=Methylobacillus flagellatus (strain ATCC 51484 / DSM 6875 / VKM B-1610 / KT) TaxID=265072 RepID=AROE_METFK|nr:shikimate dehydrogenase [Methylobacillus flagellatus]Q1GYH7.1 RecName: Full=Shikimate dehydrogenase (NADP(+)); Short=SDH [Methylobacillus flagellatus KT]ABE50710.1 shikimate dehydrogenase [Methylobacillus flagellatus KT]